MTETNVRPDPGDDDEKLWNEMVAADQAKAGSTDDEPDKATDKEADTGKADASADKDAKDTADGKDAGKPAAAAADDDQIWAKAPPELRAARDAELAAIRTELERERTNAKRATGSIAGEQRARKAAEQKLADAVKAAAEKPKPDAEPDPLDDEQWAAFEAEYPELAKGPVGAMRKRMLAAEAKVGKVETDIGGLTSERYVQHLREHLLFVEDKHPDYGKIKGSDEFAAWYEAAPAYVKAGVQRNANEVIDGQEVADILAKFKAETGWAEKPANPAGDEKPASQKPPASDKRALQMQSANAPRGRGPAKVTTGPPDDADEEALFDYYVEQGRKEERARNR